MALISHLERYRVVDRPHRFLEEVKLNGGEVRADLVDVPLMHCYEIKSDLDTLARLNTQGSRYGKVFNKVTLVTSERHLARALPMIPTWWGVLLIPGPNKMVFQRIRKARSNTRVDKHALVSLLSRDEALSLLARYGLQRGWKSKSLYLLHDKLAETLDINELKALVQSCLLKRSGAQR